MILIKIVRVTPIRKVDKSINLGRIKSREHTNMIIWFWEISKTTGPGGRVIHPEALGKTVWKDLTIFENVVWKRFLRILFWKQFSKINECFILKIILKICFENVFRICFGKHFWKSFLKTFSENAFENVLFKNI